MDINTLDREIYNLAKQQNQISLKKLLDKENDIIDYELGIKIYFHTDTNIMNYADNLKPHFLNDIDTGINKVDSYIHNIIDSKLSLNLDEIYNIEYEIISTYKYNHIIQTV